MITSKPELFGLSYSVYSRIAMLALEVKNVDYDFSEIDVFAKGESYNSYLRINPFGKIPTLKSGNHVLYETSAIVRYIDERYDGAALQPYDPIERSKINQIIGILDSYAYPSMIWPIFVERVSVPIEGGTPDENKISKALPLADICLAELDILLLDIKDVCGSNLSIAQIYAAPMLMYFNKTSEGREMISKTNYIAHWLKETKERSKVLQEISRKFQEI